MNAQLVALIIEAMVVYFLVLGTHALRLKFGRVPFYALLGAITVVMSWVTDAGAAVEVMGITFYVGSTVFYTSLLLGVFVVYVCDGPRATRIAICCVAGISALAPILLAVLHFHMGLVPGDSLESIPMPSLRINTASVITTMVDLVFLGIAWEYLGRPNIDMKLWKRAFLTLLGVMWLDVLLFSTGAFAGTPNYLSIMGGTLTSRFIIALFSFPFLYAYLHWQSQKDHVVIENRPVLAIVREYAEIEAELSVAQKEIQRRKKAEEERDAVIEDLREALSEVKALEGLLPICSKCKKIRNDTGNWDYLERYIQDHSDAEFSHSICPECAQELYPEMDLYGDDDESSSG